MNGMYCIVYFIFLLPSVASFILPSPEISSRRIQVPYKSSNDKSMPRYSSRSISTCIRSSIASTNQQQETKQQLLPLDDDPSITIKSYKHKSWNLSYFYKPPSPGYESQPPIVFVHPVGVGLSSWFWLKTMREYGNQGEGGGVEGGNPAMYAVDLIGCGLEHNSDKWDPQEEGLFFPLSWVEGVETLIQNIVLPEYYDASKSKSEPIWKNILGKNNNDTSSSNQSRNGCTVVVQGGLASVGIMLASRNNPTSVVSKLILTSPPKYDDMITPVPQKELETNYNFLSSPLWGNLAFSVLESRPIIRLFSDLFLFSDKCDEMWLDYTMNGASFKESRTPVISFNAGLLSHRSFEDEMVSLDQEVLIVCGKDDKRTSDRMMYCTEMKDCRIEVLDGCNVVPWENERDFVKLIKEFQS